HLCRRHLRGRWVFHADSQAITLLQFLSSLSHLRQFAFARENSDYVGIEEVRAGIQANEVHCTLLVSHLAKGERAGAEKIIPGIQRERGFAFTCRLIEQSRVAEHITRYEVRRRVFGLALEEILRVFVGLDQVAPFDAVGDDLAVWRSKGSGPGPAPAPGRRWIFGSWPRRLRRTGSRDSSGDRDCPRPERSWDRAPPLAQAWEWLPCSGPGHAAARGCAGRDRQPLRCWGGFQSRQNQLLRRAPGPVPGGPWQ